MPVDLKVPSAGESVTEVQIGQWRKAVGDFVNADEIIVDIETDKATMELPAPAAGVLTAIRMPAGSAAKVGDVIGQIDDTARAPAGAKAAQSTPAAKSAAIGAKSATPVAAATTAAAVAEPHVMPAARRMLAEHGLQPGQVAASGPGGRLLKEDVQRHLEQTAAPREADGHAARQPAAAGLREEEAVPMTMLRRRIAERLVEAQHTAAMLTTFNEIDMTAVMQLRKERAEAFEKRYGVKLGFMSFFVKAAVDALRTIPQVNAEIRNMPAADGRSIPHIVYHNYCDIGVAVSTEQGLVVPVIRNAERLSFAEIELTIGELANRARARKLTLDELQGGTFTISNGGVFGSLMSTPILNPPQSGILGLHAIQDRPVARDGQIVIRPMMYVALSYDHRIVDGRESVTFLKRIKECVEDPTRMLLEI